MSGRRIFAGRGKAQIELSGAMRDMVDRVLSSQGVRRVADRLEDGARRIYDDARGKWPVASGRSKDALTYGLRLPSPTALEAFVANTSDYWFYIHKPWPEGSVFVARELIIKPGRREAKRIAKTMAHELKKLAGGG
jgi:hypothetical protein